MYQESLQELSQMFSFLILEGEDWSQAVLDRLSVQS